MGFTWPQLAEDVINSMLRSTDRQPARHVYARHRDFYGKGFGLTKEGATELGYHGVADFIQNLTGKGIDLMRGPKGEVLGWSIVGVK